jgi:uncharacterized membrane protein (UPF0127 family)
MFFMRRALDVVYADRDHRVVKAVRNLKPFRVPFGGRDAHIAIELPVGTIEAAKIERGDQLEIEESRPV